jgi:hypothetical protein
MAAVVAAAHAASRTRGRCAGRWHVGQQRMPRPAAVMTSTAGKLGYRAFGPSQCVWWHVQRVRVQHTGWAGRLVQCGACGPGVRGTERGTAPTRRTHRQGPAGERARGAPHCMRASTTPSSACRQLLTAACTPPSIRACWRVLQVVELLDRSHCSSVRRTQAIKYTCSESLAKGALLSCAVTLASDHRYPQHWHTGSAAPLSPPAATATTAVAAAGHHVGPPAQLR